MLGKLYIVSTPIGNLDDITIRALETIKKSDYILAESSVRTSKLLSHYKIKKKIITFNKDNEKRKCNSIISDLDKGRIISLVTDAGTPSISDPGYELIAKINPKYSAIPIPGPSSLTCALSVSTIPINNFIFFGFLPKKSNERIKKIKEINKINLPAVIYESKHRIKSLLNDIADIIGKDTLVIVFRELTKIHESIKSYKVEQLLSELEKKPLLGEITLIVNKCSKNPDSIESYKDRVKSLLKDHNPSEVVSILRLFTEYKKKELYKFVLNVRQEV